MHKTTFTRTRYFVMAWLLCLFAGLSGACATAPSPPPTPQEIRLGVLLPITEEFEVSTRSSLNAANLAAEQVNAQGGLVVGGQSYQVSLVVEDDQDLPQAAVQAARKLIARDEVVAIIGVPVSRIAIPVATVAENEQVPLISYKSTNPETTAGKRYVFRVTFLDQFQAEVLARFVRNDLDKQRAAVLYDIASEYNRDLSLFFRQEFEQLNGTVVAFESYTTDEREWHSQLETIRESHPDVLFLPNYDSDVLLQVQQARTMGITATIVGGDSWSDFGKDDLRQMDGAYYTDQWPTDQTSTQTQAFIEAYRTAYGDEPDANAALTYDAFGLLFHALEQQSSVSPESIRNGLASIEHYTGVTGTMVFHGTGDPERSVVILQVQDGQPVFYRQVDP